MYLGQVYGDPSVSTASSGNVIFNGWKNTSYQTRRRTSSQSSVSSHSRSRRTSLPALIQKNQVCNSVVDVAVMQEAHGLIMDMLADPAIPSSVISGLKTVSSLLSPPSSFNTLQRPNISPLVALESRSADMEDSPYGGGERPLSLPKRLRRSLPPSLIRRMSTTWTTTTSATGMPTLEPQPLRTRSSSFRHNRDNSTSPSGSRASSPSPTSPQQVVVNSSAKGRSFSVGTSGLSPRSRDRSPSPLLLPDGNKQRSSSLSPRQLASGRLHLDDKSQSGIQDVEFMEEDTQPIPMGPVTLSVSPSSPTEKTKSENDDAELPNGDSSDGASEHKHVVDNSKNEAEERTAAAVSEKTPRKRNSVTISDKAIVIEDSGTRIVPTEGADDIDDDEDDDSLKQELVNGEFKEEEWDPTLPECAELLDTLDEWDFPIFDLADLAGDRVLSQLAYRVFMDAGIFETFRLPVREFTNYFRALEDGYWHKPYHNRLHAADVLHAVYYFSTQQIPGFTQVNPEDLDPMSRKDNDDSDSSYVAPTVTPRASISCDSSYGILAGNLPALELMALLTAAAMHDYDHPGRTNAFLVATGAPQALLYNDRSVLENHHAASSWSLFVSKPEFNFLSSLDSAELRRFRFLVIEFILATDLKRHFDFLVEFNAKIRSEKKKCFAHLLVNDMDAPGINWSSDADRLLAGQMCIKLADISGPTKVCHLHKNWTYRIAEEFYEQGDDERRLGLPVSPYMDRNAPQLAKLQEGFINHLVAPLCNAYGSAGLLPGRWLDEEEDGDKIAEKSDCGKSDDERKSESDKEDELEEEDTSSEESKLRPKRSSISKTQKMVSILTKHIKDNHEMWTKVLREEEDAEKKAAAAAESKEKVESPEKMSMPLIREDSEERNSDDRAAIEEVQLRIIEEKNSAAKTQSLIQEQKEVATPTLTEQKIQVAMATEEDNLEDAPHEPSQSGAVSGAPSAEEISTEQNGVDSSVDVQTDT
ncbi:LOW QUALITY PROTEIN: cGMP-inhibited 3',5'-cyclic phosphodiesterase 3A-like [Amphiura filiformis]|uniref:LOW QUALITY PROTEIN: cGMP-inhibited 3',5'-cyclic phosphodiesterase 3A-like n=1 Tax=Amphiura filiformis TaxID=82378 RepID=UPI003B2261FA